jgi:hypothetical protein
VAGAIACILFLRPSDAADGSALSASPNGWLAARTYLERRGSTVTLLDRPLDTSPANATEKKGKSLVLAFPWQVFPSKADLDALRQRLAAGGSVVFAYSGQSSVAEERVASALGLDFAEVRGAPPLSPVAWYRFTREEWWLEATRTSAHASVPKVVVDAPDRVPNVPKNAEVLYRGRQEVPAIFSFPRSRGRVIVLPACGLSNARLGNSGNADLLESLRITLGGEIGFDEYHHGLLARDVIAPSGKAPNVDLFFAQLFLLYLAIAWALGKRFGLAWEEPPEIASSTEAFLLGLGALHRKLRHSAPACVRLLDDAESLDPRLEAPPGLRNIAFDAGEHAFLDVARAVARLQRRREI